MNSILVPVDFSPVSINAVHYATNMALAMEADLVLLNTYSLPLTFTEVPVTSISIDELASISEKRLGELKNSIEHLTSGKLKVFIESRLGDLTEQVRMTSEKLLPKAVVMGTLGHGPVHDFFLGGNTVSALRSVDTPVVVIPMGVVFKKPGKVGLACDLNEVVETIPSKRISEILSWFGSSLVVLNVHSGSSPLGDFQHSESLLLDTLLADLKPVYSFLEGEDVCESIRGFAETNEIDWIVVVPKSHRKLSELLHKSVSRELAYTAHIPLVAVHD
jgi:nucleotide-binding universal stress UspA family protein